jgi:hypothetical protein
MEIPLFSKMKVDPKLDNLIFNPKRPDILNSMSERRKSISVSRASSKKVIKLSSPMAKFSKKGV